MRMQERTKDNGPEPAQTPQLIERGMVQYLTLTSGNRHAVDQEDLEWPLVLVAEELKVLLKTRGIEWEIPLFERMISLDKNEKPQFILKLLMELPSRVSWSDYDTIIKRGLAKRRDFWVVQIRFERITEGKCIRLLHRGDHTGIPLAIKEMQRFAWENNLEVSGACHEIYSNDPEETPSHELETILLIPVRKKL
jgi:hypothetical protein